MSDPVIEFDHVYKKFARGEQHTTLRDLIPALISSWWNKKKIDEQALKGEDVVIASNGEPMVRLVPVVRKGRLRGWGNQAPGSGT